MPDNKKKATKDIWTSLIVPVLVGVQDALKPTPLPHLAPISRKSLKKRYREF